MCHIKYKYCPNCKEDKSLDEFGPNRSQRDGLQTWCRNCHSSVKKANYDPQKNREYKIKHRYNLEWDTYLDMLADQHGKCPICMEDLNMDPECPRSGLAPVVDHDHDTGRVRAILCADCNRGIGMFKENPDALWAAARYVIEQKAEVIYVSREDSGD